MFSFLFWLFLNYLLTSLFVCLFVCLLACLLACLLVCLFVCLFVCLLFLHVSFHCKSRNRNWPKRPTLIPFRAPKDYLCLSLNFICCLVVLFFWLLIQFSLNWLTDWLVDWFLDWLIDWFNDWIIFFIYLVLTLSTYFFQLAIQNIYLFLFI